MRRRCWRGIASVPGANGFSVSGTGIGSVTGFACRREASKRGPRWFARIDRPLAKALFTAGQPEKRSVTWSIIARDEATGRVGIIVATRFFAVGALVPHIKTGVGAVATQAFVNPHYGPQGLAWLEAV